MKRILPYLLGSLFLLKATSAIAVHVDSISVYSENYNADSSRILLYAKTIIGTSSCYILDTTLASSSNFVQVNLCYAGGSASSVSSCSNVIDLGIWENGTINVLAILKEYYNGQCSASFLYQDSFEFVVNTGNSALVNVINANEIALTTNPVHDKLCFQNVSLPCTKLWCEVFTVEGQSAIPIQNCAQANFEMDVSTLPTGVYFLQLQDDKQRWVKKFVKY